MAIETTVLNGSLISEQVQQLVIGPLEQESTFLAAGPQILDSNEPVSIPRIAQSSSAAYVTEGTEYGDASIDFDDVKALPSTLKPIGLWLPVSKQLIRTAAVKGLDSILRDRLVTDIARKLDQELWTGTGASNTIRGLINTVGKQAGDLDTADINSLMDALTLAESQHVKPTTWAMSAATFNKFRKIKRGTGDAAYVLDPNAHEGTTYKLLGLPVVVTSFIPDDEVLLYDTQRTYVVRDLDAEVFITEHTLAKSDAVAIRVTVRMDLAVAQAKSVVHLTVPSGG